MNSVQTAEVGGIGLTATPQDLFRQRQQRFLDAVHLEIPDRVPLEIGFGYFPAKYCGIPHDACYYDYDTWLWACKKTLADFGADISSPQPFFPGAILELIDPHMLRWPGRYGVAMCSHQIIDGEYMRDDEYPQLISDPIGFTLRRYLPRMSGAMEGFAGLGLLPSPDMGHRGVIALADMLTDPEVEASLEALLTIGREFKKWRPKLAAFFEEIKDLGFPPYFETVALAPYDVIADNLRGMRGTMCDLYNHPDELAEACESILGTMLERIGTPVEGTSKNIFIPLHFGSEGFCSLEQFEKYYWPTLRDLVIELADRGFLPVVSTEGDYTSRLEYLLELPKGACFVHFESTDMFRAKDVLRGHHCISGNVPTSLLVTGTPDEVCEYCEATHRLLWTRRGLRDVVAYTGRRCSA